MSSSAFDPQETSLGGNTPSEERADSQSHVDHQADNQADKRAQQRPEHDFFEQVMRETQDICDEGADIDAMAIDPAEKEAIFAVARKFRGHAFALDPVLIELVHAVLRSQLPARANSSDAWREVAGEIAATLMQDPVASKRLEKFWARLTDSSCAGGDEP